MSVGGHSPGYVLEYLTQVEEQAEDILADKHQLLTLDKKRQRTREAVRAVQKDKDSKKHWVCFGNQFIKLPKPNTKKLLDKDYDELDLEINEIRTGLKKKMNSLRDMQEKDELKGFDLKPFSPMELRAIKDIL